MEPDGRCAVKYRLVQPLRTAILAPELQQQLDSELRQGEKLLWSAQPLPRVARGQGIGLFIFGIPWTAFSVGWIWVAATSARHGPAAIGFFPLFGLPFLLIGIGMLTAPIWMRRRYNAMIYAVTDQRALIIRGKLGGGMEVQSYFPDRLTNIIRNERADGTGDLVFERTFTNVRSNARPVSSGFVGIERVRDVEDLIMTTLLKSGPGAPH